MANRQSQWIKSCVNDYESRLIGYARTLTGDLDSARDVVQDVFLKLLEQDRHAIESKLAAWLFTVTRNKALDYLRKEKRMDSIAETSHIAAQGQSPDTATELKDQSQHLLELIKKLPQQQQEVIRLKFQHGLKYKEIAKVMKLKPNHVGVIIHQALKALREQAIG